MLAMAEAAIAGRPVVSVERTEPLGGTPVKTGG